MEPFNEVLRARAKSISNTEDYSQLVLEHYYPESVETAESQEGNTSDTDVAATTSVTDSLMSAMMMPLTISNDIVLGAFGLFGFDNSVIFSFLFSLLSSLLTLVFLSRSF